MKQVRMRIKMLPQCVAIVTLLLGVAEGPLPAQSTPDPKLQSPVPVTGTAIHQEIDLDAPPEKIYQILLDSKLFADFSGGGAADINPIEGGAISMFGGRIVGRNIELVPNKLIVQAWREPVWPAGEYSIVRFELQPEQQKTKVVLDHTGFSPGDFAHLEPGWKVRYWDPLKKFLAKRNERSNQEGHPGASIEDGK
jgi:activator of HSP90 ATPase